MNKSNLLSSVAVIICTFLLVFPKILPVCSGLINGMLPMVCHYTAHAEFALALLALILSGSLFLFRTREARFVIGFTLLLLGVLIILLPESWAIGICRHGAAACHRTFFWTGIGGGLLMITSALTIWLNRKINRSKQNEIIDSKKSLTPQTAKFNLDNIDCNGRGDRF